MFIPAKIKLSEMILIALMQISCVVPDNSKRDENGTASSSIAASPMIMIKIV